MSHSEVVETARVYYNSDDAEEFYSRVWGGEDIHIGLYKDDKEPIFDASRRTVEKIAEQLNPQRVWNILDLGAGYGGTGRYLAAKYGCRVESLNLSEVQNERNRRMTAEQGLTDLIKVTDGSFEQIPSEDETFDAIWSQDAFLHSGNREAVIKEAARVLKSGGDFIFTDIMQADDCPEGVLTPVYARIHLDSLGSPSFYGKVTADYGMKEIAFLDHSEQLPNHYGRVLSEITERYDEITQYCSKEYIDRMMEGLRHWINAGKNGHLRWGILHYRKA